LSHWLATNTMPTAAVLDTFPHIYNDSQLKQEYSDNVYWTHWRLRIRW